MHETEKDLESHELYGGEIFAGVFFAASPSVATPILPKLRDVIGLASNDEN